jgi:hypothetical protein
MMLRLLCETTQEFNSWRKTSVSTSYAIMTPRPELIIMLQVYNLTNFSVTVGQLALTNVSHRVAVFSKASCLLGFLSMKIFMLILWYRPFFLFRVLF